MTAERTAHRLSRILALLPWIIERGGAEIEDLVTRFNYEDKADLVKDLHLVFMTGLPGYGPGELIDVDISDGEVFVDAAEYFSRPLRLTGAEALGLLAAGMTFLESDLAPPALHSAIAKLTAVVIPEAESIVHFEVPTPPTVGVLRGFIQERRVVQFVYVSLAANKRTLRNVEGRSVFFNLGNWYFSAFCREAEAERIFRIDRIVNVVGCQDVYAWESSAGRSIIEYRPGESDVRVSFTTERSARWVAEYYPVNAVELDDGRQRITMSVSDPLVAARLLLRLGDVASEISGSVVLAAMDDLRHRIREGYELSR